MNARKFFLIAMLFVLAITAIACTAAPTPTTVPTPIPPSVAPKPTDKPTEAPKPTVAPTVAPTTAPAAFDIKAALDKYLTALPDGFGTIAPAALKDQMAATKVFIVDLREASEVTANGFVAGAVNIPTRAFMKNLDKLPAKDQLIVVMCGSGHRSALGMMALQMLGYTNVKSLAGGFNAWKTANLLVATGAPVAPMAGMAPTVDKDLLAALDKYFTGLPDGWGGIAPAALNDQLAAAKLFQVDVRETTEVTSGFIAGSVNVPIRTLIKNLGQLPKDQTAVIIAECGSGHRSAMTMMALNLLGYTNIKSLSGGFAAWKTANLPVATK